MKLNIELLDSQHPLPQLYAINKYIETHFIELGIEETGRDTGVKVYHDKGVHHVMCNKTKKGNYTLKVWYGV